MGETFLHAGVATPGHDSSPILPLWPDPGSHPGVTFSHDPILPQFGLPVKAMVIRQAYEPRTRGPLPHRPLPARPVEEPMSRRQSCGTNLPVSDPFTEIRDDRGVNFKLNCSRKGPQAPTPTPYPFHLSTKKTHAHWCHNQSLQWAKKIQSQGHVVVCQVQGGSIPHNPRWTPTSPRETRAAYVTRGPLCKLTRPDSVPRRGSREGVSPT